MPPNTKNRVKVYHLNAEGAWEDQGTGFASIHEKCVYCHAEEGNQLILEAPISLDDIYQRQGETIISWNDPHVRMDLALSFQEAENCQILWEELCSVQGRTEAVGAFRPESPTFSGVADDNGGVGADLPDPDMVCNCFEILLGSAVLSSKSSAMCRKIWRRSRRQLRTARCFRESRWPLLSHVRAFLRNS